MARTRARRRIREAVRLCLFGQDSNLDREGITFDVVLIARPPAVTTAFTQIEADVNEFSRRLVQSP